MKKKFIAILIAAFVALGYFVSSCSEEATNEKDRKATVATMEETVSERTEELFDENAPKNTDPRSIKRTLKGKDKLVDENEFYKVFVRRDEYDSVSFSVVWMLDKADNSRIIVTDPAQYFYKYAPKYVDADMWRNDPRVYISGHRKSIGNASEAKLISDKKHPWKLALYCHGWQHNFSTMIVSENDTSYISLENQTYLGKSKYEDVWFFSLTDEDDSYANRYYSVLVLYNSKFKEIRRKNIRIDNTKGASNAKNGKIGGVKVDFDSIKNIIRTYDVSWAFDDCKQAKAYDTQAENGDIISYVVLQPGNATYRMPSNDGFVDGVIEDGLMFQSYGINEDGSKYAILEVYNRKFKKVYEVNGNGR